MQRRDAIDGVGAEEGEVAHPDPAPVPFLDQRDRRSSPSSAPGCAADVLEVAGVEQVNDLHVARQQPLHELHRPGLERLGQQRVVGVGDAGERDLPGLVPVQAVDVDQQAHQLDDDDGRVGVVELDGDLVGEGVDGRRTG